MHANIARRDNMPKYECAICENKEVDRCQALTCPHCKKTVCLSCAKQCECTTLVCKQCKADKSIECKTCTSGGHSIVHNLPC